MGLQPIALDAPANSGDDDGWVDSLVDTIIENNETPSRVLKPHISIASNSTECDQICWPSSWLEDVEVPHTPVKAKEKLASAGVSEPHPTIVEAAQRAPLQRSKLLKLRKAEKKAAKQAAKEAKEALKNTAIKKKPGSAKQTTKASRQSWTLPAFLAVIRKSSLGARRR